MKYHLALVRDFYYEIFDALKVDNLDEFKTIFKFLMEEHDISIREND